MKTKKIYLEILRIIAMFLVIVNHTNSSIFLSNPPSPLWYTSVTYFFISKIAVPVFLMISGVTLLSKSYSISQNFFRVGRMCLTLFVISAWYYLSECLYKGVDVSALDFIKKIYHTPMSNALWYLYLYIGILIMLPILQKVAAALEKRDLLLVILISMIQPTMALFSIWYPSLLPSEFVTAPFFSAYLGMMFLGLYIDRYTCPDNKRTAIVMFLTFISLLIIQVLLMRQLYHLDSNNYLQLDNRCFPTIVLSAAAFFYFIRYLNVKYSGSERISRMVLTISSLTFGGYLLSDYMVKHCSFIYTWCLNIFHLPVMLSMVIYQLAVMGASLAIAFLLKQIPIIRKLIS